MPCPHRLNDIGLTKQEAREQCNTANQLHLN